MLADGFEFHVTGPPEFVVLVFLFIILPLYFLPTIVAVARRCRTAGWVFLLDLLLGWTVIGWVVALAIAVGSRRGPADPSALDGPVTMSPDGRYWWDGSMWRDAEATVPPHAERSPDGYYWWDGKEWRLISPPPGVTWTSPPG